MAGGREWDFTLPGQPPSWNHSYKIVQKYGRRGPYSSLAKKDTVVAYQQAAIPIIRSARPSRWEAPELVSVAFWFHLVNDIDCDNIMKAIHDSIGLALGIDDKRFIPCVREKRVGVSPAGVIVRIGEHHASPWLPLPPSSATRKP